MLKRVTGFLARSRSWTAALKIERSVCTTSRTVPGERVSERSVTHACTSDVRTAESLLPPSRVPANVVVDHGCDLLQQRFSLIFHSCGSQFFNEGPGRLCLVPVSYPFCFVRAYSLFCGLMICHSCLKLRIAKVKGFTGIAKVKGIQFLRITRKNSANNEY